MKRDRSNRRNDRKKTEQADRRRAPRPGRTRPACNCGGGDRRSSLPNLTGRPQEQGTLLGPRAACIDSHEGSLSNEYWIVFSGIEPARSYISVFRSAYLPEGRWVALALLAVVWTGLAPRSASATGCHVPERPALDFSIPWLADRAPAPAVTSIDRPPPGFSHWPCPSDARHSSVQVASSLSAATETRGPCERTISARLPVDTSRPLVPRSAQPRLDRPPRSSAHSTSV